MTNDTDAVRAILRIEGRVQGVGFRAATLRQARQLGLRGWVRNAVDGSVEVDVEGASATVEQFVVWCHNGPPAARVSLVSRASATPMGSTTFSIR